MTSDTKEHGEAVMKPCPFCGNENLREGQGDMYFIECEPCYDNFGTHVCAEGAARHDAVAMWNRRQRPTPERMELPQGVKRVDEQRLREIMSGYMEFHAPDDFEIRALAYEVRNWRGLAAVSDAALEAAAKGET